jgi:hypothetical protein
MSYDDNIRKWQETQDYLRRTTDPLGDTLRRSLLGTQNSLGILAGPSSAYDALKEATRGPDYIRELATLSNSAYAAHRMFESVTSPARLLAGPMDEARHALSATANIGELTGAFSALKAFESSFRLPVHSEIGRLTGQIDGVTSHLTAALGIADPAKSIHDSFARMHTPWLHNENLLGSASSFATIQTLGQGLKVLAPFDDNLTSVLRGSLGDWRDVAAFPATLIGDPVARSGFYVQHGFNPDLTAFPAAAFDEMTTAAGIAPAEDDGDEDGIELRSVRAFRQLLGFERRLRAFINRVMTEVFGDDWMKHQLPNNMLEGWEAKRETALKNGETEQALIDYADFTDYEKIVCRSDNWKKAFAPYFGGRIESVRESFFRLGPARVTTMHARIITLDDEVFLDVEIKRLMRAILRAER